MKKLFLLTVFLIVLVSGCVEDVMTPTTTTISTTTTEIPTTITTTTIEETTTTIEQIENTTSTTNSKRCRFLNFQIKSHLYRNDKLTLYFHNIGSEEIDDIDINLYFTNKTQTESFTGQNINYHTIRIYELDVGPGLDNVTIVETSCGKSYFVKV